MNIKSIIEISLLVVKFSNPSEYGRIQLQMYACLNQVYLII